MSGVVNPHAGSASLPRQVAMLAGRSVRRTVAAPSRWMPGWIMPLILLTINSSGLQRATQIPGFPADSYVDFALVLTFMQASLFATSQAGLALAADIESGFLDRLSLTPMRSGALVAAQIAGATLIAVGAAVVFVVVGLAVGVDFKSGAVGIATLLLLAAWQSFAFASLGAWIALRSGSSEALQGIFPLFFASLFLSTVNMPRELIQADWFRAVTRVNPVSYMVDGIRSLIITGWDASRLAQDLAVLTVITVVVVALCAWQLRHRGRVS